MPTEIKATVWERDVDDCFVVYEDSDAEFDRLLNMLNSFDPFIKFTHERSNTSDEVGLGPDVEEALPFLDLVVISTTFSDETERLKMEFPLIAPFGNRPAGLFCWYFGPINDILMQMKAHDLLCPIATTN